MKSTEIILTDWAKKRYIEANYRGVETDELFRKLDEAFHLMVPYLSGDLGGGYIIFFTEEGVKKELEFRKARRSGCMFLEGCAGRHG